jgi:EmrB/QacA subfamily drug resistance transporter
MQAIATTVPTVDTRRRWIILLVVCLAQIMMVVDSTIVNVALPAIQADLHFDQASLTWVVNGYLLTYGSFLLTAGRLGDLAGRKSVFLWGVAIFTVASAVCGLAQDQVVLVMARLVQGVGGAVSTSVVLAILVVEFQGAAERAKAMSMYMFVIVSGGSLGLLLGGAIVQAVGWHWIFFVNLPVGIATFFLGAALLDDSGGIGFGEGVDVVGSLLVTAALMLGVYGIVTSADHGWLSLHTLGFSAAAIALLSAFVAVEARIANPILPLRMLRLRSLTTASGVRAIQAVGMFSSFFFGALYLQRVHGFGSVQTGLAFLPMTLAVGTLSLGITTRLVARFGPKRTLVPGLVGMIAGLLILARADETTAYFPSLFLAFLLMGIGAGTSFMPVLTMAMAEVPKRDAGVASAIANVSMQMAATIGLAVLGSISAGDTASLIAQGHPAAQALTDGFHVAFAIGAACLVVGIGIAALVLRTPRPEPEVIQEVPARAEPELEIIGVRAEPELEAIAS